MANYSKVRFETVTVSNRSGKLEHFLHLVTKGVYNRNKKLNIVLIKTASVHSDQCDSDNLKYYENNKENRYLLCANLFLKASDSAMLTSISLHNIDYP